MNINIVSTRYVPSLLISLDANGRWCMCKILSWRNSVSKPCALMFNVYVVSLFGHKCNCKKKLLNTIIIIKYYNELK